MEEKNYYEKEFIPSIVRWGRGLNLLGVLFAFFPVIVCTAVYRVWPGFGPIIAGFVMQASVSGVFWFVEPISYFPVLGIPGTYMSFLSGNIGNLRLPASVAAQEAADVEPGTEKGNVISTLGIAVSIIVNVLFLTVGVILGEPVLSLLPANVVAALNNLLPALFGAMLAQQFVPNPKIGTVSVVLAGSMLLLSKNGLLSFLPGTPTYAVIIVAVFGSILIGRKIKEAELRKANSAK